MFGGETAPWLTRLYWDRSAEWKESRGASYWDQLVEQERAAGERYVWGARGVHWLGLRLHGRDGSVEDWPEQRIVVEAD